MILIETQGDTVLQKTAGFSRQLRILAHGDYQDAKHLADYVALLSRVIFLAALSAIIWKRIDSTSDQIFYIPLALGMAILVIHLMKHIYWMTYDYISGFLHEADNDVRETLILVLSIAVTLTIVAGVTYLYMDIIKSEIGIGAWITSHDQP